MKSQFINKNQKEKADKAVALLGLACQKKQADTECIDIDDLYALRDQKVESGRRLEILDHLNNCEDCYDHWQYVLSKKKKEKQPSGKIIDFFQYSSMGFKSAVGFALIVILATPIALFYPSPNEHSIMNGPIINDQNSLFFKGFNIDPSTFKVRSEGKFEVADSFVDENLFENLDDPFFQVGYIGSEIYERCMIRIPNKEYVTPNELSTIIAIEPAVQDSSNEFLKQYIESVQGLASAGGEENVEASCRSIDRLIRKNEKYYSSSLHPVTN